MRLLICAALLFLAAISPSDRALLEKMLDNKDEVKWNWYVLEKGMVVKENYLIISGKKSHCIIEYKTLKKMPDNTFKVINTSREKVFEYNISKVGLSGKNNNTGLIIYGRVVQVKGKVLFCPDREKIMKRYGSLGKFSISRGFYEE